MKSVGLCSILVESGRLSPERAAQVDTRCAVENRSPEEVLLELGWASDDDVAWAVSVQQGIPFFELGEKFHLQAEGVQLVPEKVARRYCLIPVWQPGEPFLTVVMKDPQDLAAVDAVRSQTSMEVHRAISTEARIRRVIEKEYRADAHIERNIKDIIDLEAGEAAEEKKSEEEAPLDADHLRSLANEAPVIRFVNLLLMQAVRDRASDIHIEPGERDVRIRFRVDGALREVTPPPKRLFQAIITRIKILSEMDISERRLPLDGRLKFRVQGREVDVRVSSLPLAHGEKVVMRILDRESLVVDMLQIGFDPAMLARFQEVLQEPNGIILLTGPTGSGKTTTLYSALSYLRSPEINIQTVEDPVEYILDGINQMPVRAKIGMTFANALRAILRQDPDIILIGEIRDEDTARIAMQASLTGHLVLSTLHTNDATTAFSRLRDIGVEPYLIAATVRLVIAQRLVRVICPKCRKEEKPDPARMAVLTRVFPEAAGWTFYRGAGCENCNHTGYRGRKGVFEFLEVSNPIRQMILDKRGDVGLRELAVKSGMETLVRNSVRKLQDGLSTIEEVMSIWPIEET